MFAQSITADAKTVTRSWGWFLAAGIAWIVFAFIILSFNYRTVWAIAVFFGFGFIVGGIMGLAVADMTPGWRWRHILLCTVSILAGLFALTGPERRSSCWRRSWAGYSSSTAPTSCSCAARET